MTAQRATRARTSRSRAAAQTTARRRNTSDRSNSTVAPPSDAASPPGNPGYCESDTREHSRRPATKLSSSAPTLTGVPSAAASARARSARVTSSTAPNAYLRRRARGVARPPRNIHAAAAAVPRPVHGPSASRGNGGLSRWGLLHPGTARARQRPASAARRPALTRSGVLDCLLGSCSRGAGIDRAFVAARRRGRDDAERDERQARLRRVLDAPECRAGDLMQETRHDGGLGGVDVRFSASALASRRRHALGTPPDHRFECACSTRAEGGLAGRW